MHIFKKLKVKRIVMLEDEILGNLYQKLPVTLEKGLGSHVWDIDGNEYIDCMGAYGVAITGHRNQRVNNAIKNQIDKIISVHSSFYNKTRETFLKLFHMLLQKTFQMYILEIVELKQLKLQLNFLENILGKKE